MSARARRVTAALILSLPGGCAHPPGVTTGATARPAEASLAEAAGERVRAAHHAVDR